MPPLRSIPAAKPVKTERTHEENQERFVSFSATASKLASNVLSELTSLPLVAVTAVSKPESSQPAVLPRSTRDAQADLSV